LRWGLKVVSHMPWGALSGFLGVLGHESMFWGCCGGFCAPVSQYIQYIQKDTDNIHAYTYIYMHIPIIYTLGRKQNIYCTVTAVSCLLDTVIFLQIHVDTNIYLLP
jgi:hypothetical protein